LKIALQQQAINAASIKRFDLLFLLGTAKIEEGISIDEHLDYGDKPVYVLLEIIIKNLIF